MHRLVVKFTIKDSFFSYINRSGPDPYAAAWHSIPWWSDDLSKKRSVFFDSVVCVHALHMMRSVIMHYDRHKDRYSASSEEELQLPSE